jgi:hypothetical protein
MANLRMLDVQVIDDLFQLPDNRGYVLDFSDRTFRNFFAQELDVDIDDPAYSKEGTSKLRRLKCYLRTVDSDAATRALNALWNYREMRRQREGREECVRNAHGQLLQLLNRIGGKGGEDSGGKPKPAFDRAKFKELHDALIALSSLEPVRRGYDFEKFLTRLFNAFDLEARGAFGLLVSRSTVVLCSTAKTTLWKRSGRTNPLLSQTCMSFMGRSARRLLGPAGCL